MKPINYSMRKSVDHGRWQLEWRRLGGRPRVGTIASWRMTRVAEAKEARIDNIWPCCSRTDNVAKLPRNGRSWGTVPFEASAVTWPGIKAKP